ncbi:phytoene synthase [Sphingomonas laterariae]|uniref:Phytoene synthase n=1 Tax=Edaphosphingomonas laterariae TaxID=861865 RepID=A0A239BTL3_9SPHN|nr:phytoene/squalene synthase family protein [Sphingomonas laterariae]SNS10771.1 phytoene synthase [Sphingomonas laterariae]
MSERAALVAAAQRSIARGSKSFRAASRLFGRPTRERAWLLYAWCRRCDDLADGQDHGHAMARVDDPAARLAEIERLTEQALAGAATGDPAFDALGVVVAECGIPHALPRDLVQGFALDAAGFTPRHADDLYRYCYHVAGVVGVMMAMVMGVRADDHDTLDRACDLGIAFQLANIARDINEDDAAGRCYLPDDWLAEMDVPPGEAMRPPWRPRIALLAKRLAARAEAHEAAARGGASALGFRDAWAVLSAADIYTGIAREVAARGEQAWDHRVVIGRGQKLAWAARSAALAASRKAIPRIDRAGLWTRPR